MPGLRLGSERWMSCSRNFASRLPRASLAMKQLFGRDVAGNRRCGGSHAGMGSADFPERLATWASSTAQRFRSVPPFEFFPFPRTGAQTARGGVLLSYAAGDRAASAVSPGAPCEPMWGKPGGCCAKFGLLRGRQHASFRPYGTVSRVVDIGLKLWQSDAQ